MWRKPDSPPAEDRFEEWFNRKRQESVLEGQVEAPQGPHPDDSFLRDLARKSRSLLAAMLWVGYVGYSVLEGKNPFAMAQHHSYHLQTHSTADNGTRNKSNSRLAMRTQRSFVVSAEMP